MSTSEYIPGGTRCNVLTHNRTDDFIFSNAQFIVTDHMNNAYVLVLSTLGLIEAGTENIHVIRQEAILAMSPVELEKWKRDVMDKNSRILYDATGLCDDIALLRSGSVEWIREKNGAKLLPYDLALSLSKEERAAIPQWRIEEFSRLASWALTDMMFDHRNMSPVPPGLSFHRNRVPEVLAALTDGRFTIPALPLAAEVDEELSALDYDHVLIHLNGIYREHMPAVVLGGLIPLSDDEQEVLQNMDKIQDIFRLWGYAMNSAGIFIGRHPWEDRPQNHGLSPFDNKMDMSALCALSSAIGMHDLVNTYLAGVPIEDIVA